MNLKVVTGMACVIVIPSLVLITKTLDSAPKSTRHTANYNVLHVDDVGCPQGWSFTEGLFVAKDGSRRDGCVNWRHITSTGKVAVGYLEPGETADMAIAITRKGEDQ